MSRLLPHPLLSLGLLVVWLLLNQSLSPGHLLLGALLGIGGALVMSALEPEKPRVRRPGAMLRLALLVAVDIVRSNIAVGRIILRRREPGLNAGFMTVPLDLTSRYGLAVLAMILTATPGTLWVNYDAASGRLLIHVLDLVDERTWITLIKGRYERLLLEIFE